MEFVLRGYLEGREGTRGGVKMVLRGRAIGRMCCDIGDRDC